MATHSFNADIGKVLQLVINSIYTNKEIFLRELVSNASDAIDKLRYQSITNADLTPEGYEPKITVEFDKEGKWISVRDNGIGMDEADLVNNLGMIAKSGTKDLIETVKESNDISLIGQFGVGFYSSFMVGNQVDVVTKKAGQNSVLKWSSQGISEFEINDVSADFPDFETGSMITVFLKDEDAEPYTNIYDIERIVKMYSNHIQTPIFIYDFHDTSDIRNEKSATNSSNALWQQSPSKITEEEYQEFYKNLSHMPDAPLVTIHNRVEGVVNYTNLLFVPSSRPFDLYSPEKKSAVKLYVNKVFITENTHDILPQYLRFVRGIIDSPDLPLNISRETFQNSLVLDKIKTSLTKKILGEFAKKIDKDYESYQKFWSIFGNVIKEGLCDYASDKDAIIPICLFKTTKSEGKWVTITEYVERMQDSQEDIYYITGEEGEDIESNPQLEIFKKRGIEVLLLDHTVDDFWVNVVSDFKGKPIKNVAASDTKIAEDETKEEDKADDASSSSAVDCFKHVLGERVKEVKASQKLVDSPACLSAQTGAMSVRMERYLYEQKQLNSLSGKVLEINPNHKIVQHLANLFEKDNNSQEVADIVNIIFDGACLSSGTIVHKPNEFFNRVSKVLEKLVA